MNVTSNQIRAARALLRMEQAELAAHAHVSIVTIRRIEAASAADQVSSATFAGVQAALEKAGAEFILNGVRRRHGGRPDSDALYEELRAISFQSAEQLRHSEAMTEADFYDEDGFPA